MKIIITETLQKALEIDDDYAKEEYGKDSLTMVEDLYANGNIVLGADDFINVTIEEENETYNKIIKSFKNICNMIKGDDLKKVEEDINTINEYLMYDSHLKNNFEETENAELYKWATEM